MVLGEWHQKHSGRFSVWMIDEWATTRDTLDSLTSINSLLKWEVRDGTFNDLHDVSRDVLKHRLLLLVHSRVGSQVGNVRCRDEEDAMVDNVRCYDMA